MIRIIPVSNNKNNPYKLGLIEGMPGQPWDSHEASLGNHGAAMWHAWATVGRPWGMPGQLGGSLAMAATMEHASHSLFCPSL
eukprot:1147357-Pelagomonas_calceolata.AAC.2